MNDDGVCSETTNHGNVFRILNFRSSENWHWLCARAAPEAVGWFAYVWLWRWQQFRSGDWKAPRKCISNHDVGLTLVVCQATDVTAHFELRLNMKKMQIRNDNGATGLAFTFSSDFGKLIFFCLIHLPSTSSHRKSKHTRNDRRNQSTWDKRPPEGCQRFWYGNQDDENQS